MRWFWVVLALDHDDGDEDTALRVWHAVGVVVVWMLCGYTDPRDVGDVDEACSTLRQWPSGQSTAADDEAICITGFFAVEGVADDEAHHSLYLGTLTIVGVGSPPNAQATQCFEDVR